MYPSNRSLCGVPELVWSIWGRKKFSLVGFKPQIIQPAKQMLCWPCSRNCNQEQAMTALPWPIYPLERTPVPTAQEVRWAQRQSRLEQKIQCPHQDSISRPSSKQLYLHHEGMQGKQRHSSTLPPALDGHQSRGRAPVPLNRGLCVPRKLSE